MKMLLQVWGLSILTSVTTRNDVRTFSHIRRFQNTSPPACFDLSQLKFYWWMDSITSTSLILKCKKWKWRDGTVGVARRDRGGGETGQWKDRTVGVVRRNGGGGETGRRWWRDGTVGVVRNDWTNQQQHSSFPRGLMAVSAGHTVNIVLTLIVVPPRTDGSFNTSDK